MLDALAAPEKRHVGHSGSRWAYSAYIKLSGMPKVRREVFRTMLRLRLMLSLGFHNCACGRVDPDTRHIMCCRSSPLHVRRHEAAKGELADLCRWSGASVSVEHPLALQDGDGRLDLLVARGTTLTGYDVTFSYARELPALEQSKVTKYKGACGAQLAAGFQPLALSSAGAAGPASERALETLSRWLRESAHPRAPSYPEAYISFRLQQSQACAVEYTRARAAHHPAAQ